MMENFHAVTDRFLTDSPVISCEKYGCGHINATYLAVTESGRRYILQRISSAAFHDVPGLMRNIEMVCAQFKEADPDPRHSMTLIRTQDDAVYFKDADGEAWRMYDFIEGTVCLQRAETKADFRESAVAFGNFQQMLAGLPAKELTETIPHFHDTPDRYRIFHEKLAADVCGRAAGVQKEIDFYLARENEAAAITGRLKDGTLPLRVTHNDTKLNNVLLDAKTHRAVCVIDLDTVMPGSSLYDFGDSIRFGAATAAEDETDLSRMEMSLELYHTYEEGFLSACPGLTETERALLPVGAKMMTLECGLRFLTDYLDGDHYFAVTHATHNLERCRTQAKLVADMEKKLF